MSTRGHHRGALWGTLPKRDINFKLGMLIGLDERTDGVEVKWKTGGRYLGRGLSLVFDTYCKNEYGSDSISNICTN